MRKLFTLFLLLTTFFCFSQTSKDYTVQAWVIVDKSKPSITIKWQKLTTGVTAYEIYRKTKDSESWGVAKGKTAASDTMWTDIDIKVGETYEYNLVKINGASAVGITYILSGIEIPVVHSRGNALVVVEKTLAKDIAAELDGYYRDLASDGWKVYNIEVMKTDSIQKVKREIKKIDAQSGELKSLIILGHVPVPYSGNFGLDNYYTVPPDGHAPDHNGAWPTDAYYSVDSDLWTDNLTNDASISRSENKNLPGDSKWDNIDLPGLVKYYTGRIDLSNMSKFTKTEAELTKQYIKKAHDFRFKNTVTLEKGVIDENFSASIGAFASTGWRNFSVMFGPKNIIESDYLSTCRNQNLLFGYGAGAGSYQSCSGIGTTDSFVKTKPAVFNMLFGSYFGDWDNANNILRAPLASAENGLTNAWSGRPWWQNHPMALGEPIGYCAMITQNNKTTYSSNIFANTIPIGLMGDPTLRLHIVAPPTNVIATSQDNNTKVNLTWTATNELGNLGYYIYRSANPLSNNFPINKTPITGNSFTDNSPYQGTNYYLIKSVKLTTSASGSYFNLSQGAGANITGITGSPANIENTIKSKNLTVYPNPSKNTITLNFSIFPESRSFEIVNTNGQIVRDGKIDITSNLSSTPIYVGDLSSGLYFIKMGSVSCKFIKD